MKKTEIVRVRIDSPTYSAYVQHCQNTGESLSTVLRKSLKAVIKKEVDTSKRSCTNPMPLMARIKRARKISPKF
jgi:antitoxin component of RelBE/YafQ-DinJ toxin-antitoxin module